MPRRANVKTVSGGPQGHDAKITIRLPTVDESTAQNSVMRETDNDATREILAREFLGRHVVDWNWVMDDDTPMPKPFNNPDVFGALTNDEMRFVGEALNGQGGPAGSPGPREKK